MLELVERDTMSRVELLLVEDSAVDAESVERMLRGRANVRKVESLHDCLSVPDDHTIDAMLLDLHLPDSDGLDTLKAVRKRYPGIPIIVLSGFSDRNIAVAALREGAQEYCVKGDIAGPLLLRSIEHTIVRWRARNQANQAEKLESLGVMAGGIVHDFNNLLVGILGNADLAGRALPADSPIHARLGAIEEAGRRAAKLVDQIHSFAGNGGWDEVRRADLRSIVEDAVYELRTSLMTSRIQYDYAPEVPDVEVDPAQIQRAVVNLIINAFDAIDRSRGTVLVRTGVREASDDNSQRNPLPRPTAGRYAFLEVVDSGCGMDEVTQSKIFDPFFTTKFAGRGLGLAVVLGIVRRHHASVEVESEVGTGTTIRLLFPFDTHRDKRVVQTTSGLMGKSVLLVDDEEMVREVGRQLLEDMGLDVLTANDGGEALRIVEDRDAQIDCVLLDFTMPVMDGEQTLREIRRVRQDVPAILCSGYSGQDLLVRFRGTGLSGFIQKPYLATDLEDALRKVFDSRVEE